MMRKSRAYRSHAKRSLSDLANVTKSPNQATKSLHDIVIPIGRSLEGKTDRDLPRPHDRRRNRTSLQERSKRRKILYCAERVADKTGGINTRVF